jgi:hypothetical protein
MSSIKIELDIPEFEKELSINVTLIKDGKKVEPTIITKTEEKTSTPKKEVKKASAPSTSFGGNMMGIDL